MRRAHGAALVAAFGALLPSAQLRAYDFQVEAVTIGQGYQVRLIQTGEDQLLNRRRLTQLLRLGVFNLWPHGPGADGAAAARNQLYVVTSMRLEHDFGDYMDGIAPAGAVGGADAIPERFELDSVEDGDLVEVLYAYVGGRELLGFLDFELGRQLQSDLNDTFAFDGLHLTARTPYWVAVEAFGGLSVQAESPLASPTFQRDGTSQVDLIRQEDAQWAEPSPTFGFALASSGFRDLSARLAYRQSLRGTGDGFFDAAGAPVDPGTTTVEQKLSYSVRGRLLDGGVTPFAGGRFNLFVDELDEVEAGVRVAVTEAHVVTAEYLYSDPSFDGDSIWNVFSSEPFQDLRLRYELWPGRGRARGYAQLFARLFRGENGDDDLITENGVDFVPDDGTDRDLGASAGGRWLLERGLVRGDLHAQVGYGGSRVGVDASGRYRLLLERLELEGRATVIRYDFDDDFIQLGDQDGTSFGLQAGGRYRLAEGIVVHLLAEENVSPFYDSQLRLLALLDLGFAR